MRQGTVRQTGDGSVSYSDVREGMCKTGECPLSFFWIGLDGIGTWTGDGSMSCFTIKPLSVWEDTEPSPV